MLAGAKKTGKRISNAQLSLKALQSKSETFASFEHISHGDAADSTMKYKLMLAEKDAEIK